MPEGLKIEFPSQGWKQILTGRKCILDAYDRARDQARSHEVETSHGLVAEAEFRKWLATFLPKRYGVTSGYVVSPGLGSATKTPHYDVIIYDQLESPVLWVEDSPDCSDQGKSRAIPVEHVYAVLEVKSHFSVKTTKDSLDHLADLAPLMHGVDSPEERYKLYLPETFCCGSVFMELRKADAGSEAAMDALLGAGALRGFFGGLILRGDEHTEPLTARLSLTQSETPMEASSHVGQTLLNGFFLGQSVPVAEKLHLGTMIMWTESAFAQFAFDLIAMIQGTYHPGHLSSFYGMGSSTHELMQGATTHPNKPDRA